MWVTGIMTVTRLVHDATRLVGKRHAVVHTHRQGGILLFEDAAELDEVGTTAKVRSLGEVAIGEDMARAQMHEVGS